MKDDKHLPDDDPTIPELLHGDSIWTAWQLNSYKDFSNALSPLYLHPDVPEPVRKQLITVRRLLLHSYFEYAFIDIAENRALQILEMALKVRYKEITGNDPKQSIKKPHYSRILQRKIMHFPNMNLKELIDWAGANELLNEPADRIHLLREIRNDDTHGNPETQKGIIGFDMLFDVVDVINELYVDPNVRRRRDEFRNAFCEVLSTFFRDGVIATLDSKRLIVFNIVALNCAERVHGFELDVVFYWICDLTDYGTGVKIPDSIVKTIVGHTVTEDLLILTVVDGTDITLERNINPVNLERYQEFIKLYRSNHLEVVINGMSHQLSKQLKQNVDKEHYLPYT